MAEKFDINELLMKEKADSKKFDYIRFTLSDINGISRSDSIPRRHAEGALKSGITLFCGIGSVNTRTNMTFTKEILELHMPNCDVNPLQGTLHDVPWAGCRKSLHGEHSDKDKRRIGQVLCETSWIPPYRNGSPQEVCTRYILRKQLERLEKVGYTFKSAFEAEFSVYHRDTNKAVFDGLDALSTLRLAEFEDYLYTMEENFCKAGIDISSLIIEHGEGQFEFGMEPVDGIKGADTMFLLKQAIKEMSQDRGLIATFMAKAFPTSSTNGLHLNMSLWMRGSKNEWINAFYDPSDKNGMSELFKYWIAGLIKHGKALCAFSCPTYNCYRRLHTFLAPSKIEWGVDDRLACYRAKSLSPSATYLENRLPSGACNPYLATACTIAAGLDGILNKLPLPQPRTETIDLASIHAPVVCKPDTETDKYFPYSLSDAIVALEEDKVIKEAMGEELLRCFIQIKKEQEIDILDPLTDKDRWKKESELFYEFL